MEELNEILFNEYSIFVTGLCIEFNIELDTLSKEKELFNPRKVYTPQKLLFGKKPYNFKAKPIDERHRGKGKDCYYLKYNSELLDMLDKTEFYNAKCEYTLDCGMYIKYPLYSIFELRYKIHKELPYSQHKYINE